MSSATGEVYFEAGGTKSALKRLGSMAIVMIHCPETGTAVSTQHHASESQFATERYDNAAVRCTACGAIHRWTKSEAWLQPYRGVAEALSR